MSLENEDQDSQNDASGTSNKSQKQSKISYTRKFLLSFRELDICKKLSSGFDQSILSEFGDASHILQDRQGIAARFSQQGFRRSDYGHYGSSPPTRGDSGIYHRGTYGRWDNQSSNWSDKDSDSQSDRDSDYGRHYGHHPHRPWQNPQHEHDGLLGSGSLPRPSGYTPGASAPKVLSNDHYQLSKSNEPYHPPRPYKAVPHSRRDLNDSINDETFGSTECTNQDRMEEERRRRASFEMMRKEQHKALQEKQKLNLEKSKDDSVSDINLLLEETKERGLLDQNHELDATTTQPVSNNDSDRSFPSQTPVSRPLVPPGFTTTILERNSGAKYLNNSYPTEVDKPNILGIVLHGKANPVQNETLDNQDKQHSASTMSLGEQGAEDKSIHAAFMNKNKDLDNSISGLASNKNAGMNDQLYMTSSGSETHGTFDNADSIEFDAKKVDECKIHENSIQETSSSILDKLFGNAMNLVSSVTSGLSKHDEAQLDDSLNGHTSKFAQWFVEEEKMPAYYLSSSRASDLLSLIVSGDKAGVQVSDVETGKKISPDLLCQNSVDAESLGTLIMSSETTAISEQMHKSTKQETLPAILTCEDLEQTILSEYSEKSLTLQPSVQEWSVSGKEIEQPNVNVDDHASQHLLSLLQKGTVPNDTIPSSVVDSRFSDPLLISGVDNTKSMREKPSEMDTGNANNMGKSLTLDILFGTAFMKELHSVEAPVSVQRNAVGSARTDILDPHGLSFPDKNDDHCPDTENRLSRKDYETNVLAYNESQHPKIGKIDNWLEFDAMRVDADPFKFKKDAASKHSGIRGAVDIQLPEEESLITVGDPVKPPSLMLSTAGSSTNSELLASKTTVGTTDELVALNPAFKDEQYVLGQEGPPFVVDHFSMDSQIPHGDLHAQASLPQFNPPPMSHRRPLLHPVDSYSTYMNSHMFVAPESIMHHDAPSNDQYAGNMLLPPFNHHSVGMIGFDTDTHHLLLQQMQMAGDFAPPHLPREVPRATPLLPHNSTQATYFIQEGNPIQRFPFGNRQPNIDGLGIQLPGYPDASQRLVKMELGKSSRHIQQAFSVSHSRGIYGHELDMGFRYL